MLRLALVALVVGAAAGAVGTGAAIKLGWVSTIDAQDTGTATAYVGRVIDGDTIEVTVARRLID